MNKVKAVAGILLAVMLLSVAACTPEPVTTTVTKTQPDVTSTVTVTQQAQTVTATTTVQSMVTITSPTTSLTSQATSSTTKTSSTTQTSSTTSTSQTTTVFTPVSSPDGKLQITSAAFPEGSTSYVRGKIKNLSNVTLNAEITIIFLNDSGKWQLLMEKSKNLKFKYQT